MAISYRQLLTLRIAGNPIVLLPLRKGASPIRVGPLRRTRPTPLGRPDFIGAPARDSAYRSPALGVGGKGSPRTTVRSCMVCPPRTPRISYSPDRSAVVPGLNVLLIRQTPQSCRAFSASIGPSCTYISYVVVRQTCGTVLFDLSNGGGKRYPVVTRGRETLE